MLLPPVILPINVYDEVWLSGAKGIPPPWKLSVPMASKAMLRFVKFAIASVTAAQTVQQNSPLK